MFHRAITYFFASSEKEKKKGRERERKARKSRNPSRQSSFSQSWQVSDTYDETRKNLSRSVVGGLHRRYYLRDNPVTMARNESRDANEASRDESMWKLMSHKLQPLNCQCSNILHRERWRHFIKCLCISFHVWNQKEKLSRSFAKDKKKKNYAHSCE